MFAAMTAIRFRPSLGNAVEAGGVGWLPLRKDAALHLLYLAFETLDAILRGDLPLRQRGNCGQAHQRGRRQCHSKVSGSHSFPQGKSLRQSWLGLYCLKMNPSAPQLLRTVQPAVF